MNGIQLFYFISRWSSFSFMLQSWPFGTNCPQPHCHLIVLAGLGHLFLFAVREILSSDIVQVGVDCRKDRGLSACFGRLKEGPEERLDEYPEMVKLLKSRSNCNSTYLYSLGHVTIEETHVSPQFGVYDARMKSIYRYAGSLQSSRQFSCEQDIRQFTLTIRLSTVVVLFTVQVGHLYFAPSMCQTRHIYHAARTGVLKQVQEQISEQEVAQMIYTELQFNAIFCLHLRTAHNTRIIHQNMQLLTLLFEPVGDETMSHRRRCNERTTYLSTNFRIDSKDAKSHSRQ